MRQFYHRICWLGVLLFLIGGLMSVSAATPRDRKKDGRLEITSAPGPYPLLIDGVASGVVSSELRLVDVPAGRHTVEIQFPNGVRWVRDFDIAPGKRHCINLNYKPRRVEIPVSPCPYTLNVSSPAQTEDGNIITFASDVDYTGNRPLNYRWNLTPALPTAVSAPSTPSLSVDTTGLGNQVLTATLTVDDGSGDPRCQQSARSIVRVIKPPVTLEPPRRLDRFPSLAFDDDKARFDSFAIALQGQPTARGYVIVYGGRTSRIGTSAALAERTRNYLTQNRGISLDRLVFVDGGFAERNTFELWVVPPGAALPTPTPTVSPQDVRPETKRTRRRR